MRLIWLSSFVMGSIFSTPFFNDSIIGQLLTFFSANGGVRAKRRNVEITKEGDGFSGFKSPTPFLFRHAFELVPKRICDRPLFKSLRDWLVWVRVPAPSIRSLGERERGRNPKKIEVPTDRREWALWSCSSGRVDLTEDWKSPVRIPSRLRFFEEEP